MILLDMHPQKKLTLKITTRIHQTAMVHMITAREHLRTTVEVEAANEPGFMTNILVMI